MIQDIMAVARAFAGISLGEEESCSLQTLCEESFIQWGNRLEREWSAEDCASALIPACACSALAAFLTLRAAAAGPAFRVGDVALGEAHGAQQNTAERLRRQAEALMAPYVTPPDDFAFRRVRG